jgi:hypothetical protein
MAVNKERAGSQTALIGLEELKRQQASEEQVRQFMAQHPELFMGQGQPPPQSVLGGGTGQPPMIQQSVMPGQPPGAPQMAPAGQDLSRFATQGQPPAGSTLGQPGPPPQGQDQLMALMRTNPDAAQAVQDRMQKIQQQRLTSDLTRGEYVGRILQGVNSQESLDDARRDIGRNLPQLAAQLPTTYAKETLQPYIDRALSVKDRATLGLQALQASTEAGALGLKERQAAAGVPKYTEDSTLNVAIDQVMQQRGIPRGTPPPGPVLAEAQKMVEEGKVRVSASHGTGQIVMTPGGAIRIGKDNQVEVLKGPDGQPIYDKPTAAAEAAASYGDRARRANDNAVALENKGITPSLWAKVGNALPLGLGDYLVGEDQRDYQRAVNQFGGALLRKESGAVISQTEYNMIDRTFFPQPNDTKGQIEDKRKEREAIIKSLQEEGKGTGRTGTSSKPVSEMSADETRAEIAAIKARGGK